MLEYKSPLRHLKSFWWVVWKEIISVSSLRLIKREREIELDFLKMNLKAMMQFGDLDCIVRVMIIIICFQMPMQCQWKHFRLYLYFLPRLLNILITYKRIIDSPANCWIIAMNVRRKNGRYKSSLVRNCLNVLLYQIASNIFEPILPELDLVSSPFFCFSINLQLFRRRFSRTS